MNSNAEQLAPTKWEASGWPYDMAATPDERMVVSSAYNGVKIHSLIGGQTTSLSIPEPGHIFGVACYQSKIYLTHHQLGDVLEYNLDGKLSRIIHMGVKDLYGITIHGGTIFVTSWANEGAVYCKSLDDADNGTDASVLIWSSAAQRLLYPRYIAVNDEFIVVSCSDYIPIFSRSGQLMNTIRDEYRGPGPCGLLLDIRANIVVCDCNNNRILVFDCQGRLLNSISTGEKEPLSITQAGANVIWVGFYDDAHSICQYNYLTSISTYM